MRQTDVNDSVSITLRQLSAAFVDVVFVVQSQGSWTSGPSFSYGGEHYFFNVRMFMVIREELGPGGSPLRLQSYLRWFLQ